MKRIFRVLFLLIVFLLGVMTLRTLLFSSKQIPIDPIQPAAIRNGAIDRLARAVQYPTVSSTSGIDTSAFFAQDTFLQSAFPRVHQNLEWRLFNGFSRLYKWPGSNPKLAPVLWLAHLDVVPVEDESEHAWAQPPFSGARHEGYIWGRGTLDDKLNVMGMLEAFEQGLEEGYQPTRTIFLALGHDEEVGGSGAQTMAKWFDQEGITFEYVLDEGSMVIEGALPGLNPPLAMIGLSEKGYVSLELMAQLSEGGHSSMPPRETAIGLLSKAIAKLEANPFPARMEGPTRALFEYAGPEMRFPLRMLFANLWLTKGILAHQLGREAKSAAIIRTTTAPTIIQAGVKDNVLPTQAHAVVNFRIIPGETPESVRDHVEKLINDQRITITFAGDITQSAPAPVSETSAFGFEVIHRTIKELMPDAVVAPGLVIGATDSRHYLKVAKQTYRFMPVILKGDELSGIHGLDERISEENYKRLIQWYLRLLENSCS